MVVSLNNLACCCGSPPPPPICDWIFWPYDSGVSGCAPTFSAGSGFDAEIDAPDHVECGGSCALSGTTLFGQMSRPFVLTGSTTINFGVDWNLNTSSPGGNGSAVTVSVYECSAPDTLIYQLADAPNLGGDPACTMVERVSFGNVTLPAGSYLVTYFATWAHPDDIGVGGGWHDAFAKFTADGLDDSNKGCCS